MAEEKKKNEGSYNITDEELNNPTVPEGTATQPAPKNGYNADGKPMTQQDLDKYRAAVERKARNYRNKAGEYEAEAELPSQVDESKRGMHLRRFIDNWKTKELTEEEKRRERNKRRIAALGDGLIALSNFAGAVGGATPLQQKVTLTEGQKKRFDAARKVQDGISEKERVTLLNSAKAADELEERRIQYEKKAEEAEKQHKLTLAKEYRRQADKIENELEDTISLIQNREGTLEQKKKADKQASEDRRRGQDVGASTAITTQGMRNAQSNTNSLRSAATTRRGQDMTDARERGKGDGSSVVTTTYQRDRNGKVLSQTKTTTKNNGKKTGKAGAKQKKTANL